jgi:hypothetical protein
MSSIVHCTWQVGKLVLQLRIDSASSKIHVLQTLSYKLVPYGRAFFYTCVFNVINTANTVLHNDNERLYVKGSS